MSRCGEGRLWKAGLSGAKCNPDPGKVKWRRSDAFFIRCSRAVTQWYLNVCKHAESVREFG